MVHPLTTIVRELTALRQEFMREVLHRPEIQAAVQSTEVVLHLLVLLQQQETRGYILPLQERTKAEHTLQVAVQLHQDHHLHHLVVQTQVQTLLIVHHQEVHRQAPRLVHLQVVADPLREAVAAVAVEAQVVVDVDNQK